MQRSETLNILVTVQKDAEGLCAWAAVRVGEGSVADAKGGQAFHAEGVSAESLGRELARWQDWLQACADSTLRLWVATQDAAWQQLAQEMQTCGAGAFASGGAVRDYVTLLDAGGQQVPEAGPDCLENAFLLAARLRPLMPELSRAKASESQTRGASARRSYPMRGADTVVFVDFDGVLQTPARDDWLEMEHCAELEVLLREMPRLGLVVTTTHRETSSQDEVLAMLPPALAERVVGLTEVTIGGRALGGRQREVLTWLSANPSVKRWVAVDDEYLLFERDCPWLVITHKWLGWTSQTTEQVRRILQTASVPEALAVPDNPYAQRLAATRRDAADVANTLASVAARGAAPAGGRGHSLPAEEERALRTRVSQMQESLVRRLWRRWTAWLADVLG